SPRLAIDVHARPTPLLPRSTSKDHVDVLRGPAEDGAAALHVRSISRTRPAMIRERDVRGSYFGRASRCCGAAPAPTTSIGWTREMLGVPRARARQATRGAAKPSHPPRPPVSCGPRDVSKPPDTGSRRTGEPDRV